MDPYFFAKLHERNTAMGLFQSLYTGTIWKSVSLPKQREDLKHNHVPCTQFDKKPRYIFWAYVTNQI